MLILLLWQVIFVLIVLGLVFFIGKSRLVATPNKELIEDFKQFLNLIHTLNLFVRILFAFNLLRE